MKDKRTYVRLEVTCPLCLMDTGRWKIFRSEMQSRPKFNSRGECVGIVIEPEVVDMITSVEFEQSVIQDHIRTGKCISNISPKVLELYSATL